jgi:hypothetical protein
MSGKNQRWDGPCHVTLLNRQLRSFLPCQPRSQLRSYLLAKLLPSQLMTPLSGHPIESFPPNLVQEPMILAGAQAARVAKSNSVPQEEAAHWQSMSRLWRGLPQLYTRPFCCFSKEA